jgi:hypothetical protein
MLLWIKIRDLGRIFKGAAIPNLKSIVSEYEETY